MYLRVYLKIQNREMMQFITEWNNNSFLIYKYN